MALADIPIPVTPAVYLASCYEPDAELVDGVIEERNLGEFDHARLTALVLVWLFRHEQDWGILVVPEQRVQVSEKRFRVPDVCVLRADAPREQIVQQAPLICIEILSPEDTFRRLQTRIQDFLRMGVAHVWVVDPSRKEAFRATEAGLLRVFTPEIRVEGSEIYLPIRDLFAQAG